MSFNWGSFDYRTIVWSFGLGFFSTIVFAQLVSWFFPNISPKIGSFIVLFITIGGISTGLILDQYYKSKEDFDKKGSRKSFPTSKKGD